MKSIEKFLADLQRLDITLWAEGDHLKYSASKGVLTPQLREQLKARKADILAFLHKKKTGVPSNAQSILPVERDGNLRLSFAQQRMWFLEQLGGASAVYNMAHALRLKGHLDSPVLERSLTEIVRRHELLRTSFPMVDGTPIQSISAIEPLLLPVIDLQPLPEEKRSDELQRLIAEEVRQPFDLTTGPLLRLTLLRIKEEEHVLLLVMHHIITDGWSMGVLIRELVALYNAFLKRKPSPLPELPIQYADFAHWQRQWLQGEVLEAQLRYWKQQLAGVPSQLELQTDRHRPPVQSLHGATEYFEIAPEITHSLKSVCRQTGTTLFMTLLAMFAILLHRYTGQEDIMIGSPIANRNRREIEPLIGFFVNTLPLRVRLCGEMNFSELLGQIKQVTLDAYTYQDVPFDQIVETLQLERNLSHTPLFQVMFVLQNVPLETLLLPGLEVSRLTDQTIDTGATQFDLTLLMLEIREGLSGELKYNPDLFDASTIVRMIGHFRVLLEAIVFDPDQSISTLPLLSEIEQKQLLEVWNDTKTDFTSEKCIHQLFEEHVKASPDAVAVEFEKQHLSYRALNQRANQVAHYLQKMGVGPETLVGICVERSFEMIIGLLGILKAGGAYIPLDPAYPKERLAFMLSDSQVPVLLTQHTFMADFSTQSFQTVCIDTDWDLIAQESVEQPENQVTPENAAYVIYTSGSTGTPKGVLVEHRGLCNLIAAQSPLFQLNSDSRLFQFVSLSFDVATSDIFTTLYSGATLCLAERDALLPGPSLIDLLREQAITHLELPASILEALPFEELPALQVLIVGGETCSPDTVTRWSAGRRFFNAYGPTETTVCATVADCSDGSCKPPIIGRPIANVHVYILDRALQPVPIGVPGELYIGGVGLARGYLNRPDMNAERFITHPFSMTPEERLYKTGDLARYLPDGNIEFLGRVDHQIKIRGFRIEPGEIEAVLTGHPSMREAVVIVREDHPGHKRLVAYLVFNKEFTFSVRELRSLLGERLPDYMIPSDFVILEKLPLTPNGKVDRHALPDPETIHVEPEDTFRAPQTPAEKTLAAIWAEVLMREQVGIHDNFFELGGDSILSIQIITKANQAGLQLAPKDLFQYQTIAKLAVAAKSTSRVIAEQGIITGSVPLTPIQEWFFEQKLSEPQHWNQALLLEVEQNLEIDILEQTVLHLITHHDALRLRFFRQESGWNQEYTSPPETISCSRFDFSHISDAEVASVIERSASELQTRLDLSEGPLIQVAFFDLGPHRTDRLLLIIHHLVIDGVSWRILLEDLQTTYQQMSAGKTIQLPPKTTSFKDWSLRLTEYAQSEALSAEPDYWLKKPWYKVTPLPIDYPSGKETNTESSTAQVSVCLSTEQTYSLLHEVPPIYNTQIDDVLLTALSQAFSQWTGEHFLLIDLERHGRAELFEDLDISRTIGWFTTVFPFLIEIGEDYLPGNSLKAVKEQLRNVQSHGFGYSLLRYLNVDAVTRSKIRTLPQAEITFNYLGQLDLGLSNIFPLKLAKESCGPLHSPLGRRKYLLEVNGFVIDGRLQLDWIYSENIHQRETIEHLTQRFIQALESLINHCQSPEAGGYTPSDFPTIALHQQQLDQMLTEICTENKIERNVEAIYPLSLSQQGMLFETLSAPKSGIYIEQSIWSLSRDLDTTAFESAWQHVIDRHPALRTGFVWKDQELPLQFVLRKVNVSWETYDWKEIELSQQQEQLEDYLKAVRLEGVNLSKVPLIRFALFQLSEQLYQFVWTFHHILMDGWCLPLLAKEVLHFYKAFNSGRNLPLAQSRPYMDYITWLKQHDISPAETFWRQKLQGFTTPTPLGIHVESDENIEQEERYKRQTLGVSASTTTTLQSLARQYHVTMNIFIQGIWALLLSRYSSNSDIVFGTTVSGRPPDLEGSETMIGFFINTQPIRIRISPDTLFWPWLKEIQNQYDEQRNYEYCSAGQIHQWSNIPGSTSLYESILVFENYPFDQSMLHFPGLNIEMRSARFIGAQTHYALTILVIPGEELSIQIIYDTRRFDAPGIENILEHFSNLLANLTTGQEQQLTLLMSRIPTNQIPKVRSHTQQKEQTRFVPPQTSTEALLAAIWAEVLELEQIGRHDNFFELGGHSLLVAQLISRIREVFLVEFPIHDLLVSPTVADVARMIEQEESFSRTTTLDLNAEVVLPSEIQPTSISVDVAAEPGTIFLTGATGFLGAYLLDELLRQTQADIYCLVRASTPDDGMQRLQHTLESYAIHSEPFTSRIIPIPGDLSQPLLGLSVEQFERLAERIEVIYHNGAWVNFLYSYPVLKAVNVLGTREILRLASQSKVKPVHYISTLSVFASPVYADEIVRETDPLDCSQGLEGGYAQSKWVAEKLVTEAYKRGLPVSIYRPGTITGHSQTGVCNTDDFFCKILKGCIQLGRIPELDVNVPITPVDYVSRAIVYLSRQRASFGKAFHLVSPRPLSWIELIDRIRTSGYPLEQIPYNHWRDLLVQTRTTGKNALHPFLPLFLESETTFQGNPRRFDCQDTLNALKGSAIVCPTIDETLFHTYFSYFIRSGFLAPGEMDE